MAGLGRNDFWSRRKAAVHAEAEAERVALEATAEAEETARLEAEQEAKSDAELLDELGLPDPETLSQGDDFAAFMGKPVPERLRRRALRRLWVSNPVLANLDGLLDHAEDFSDAATSAGTVATAYRVGQGMLKHIEALMSDEDQVARSGDEPAGDVTEDDPAEEIATPDEPDLAQAVQMDEPMPEEAPAQPRRHLRFAFAD